VSIVMLTVLFLAAALADWARGLDLLTCGGGIALVILAASVALLNFQRAHQREIGHDSTTQSSSASSSRPSPPRSCAASAKTAPPSGPS
jgi:hypothetical protein